MTGRRRPIGDDLVRRIEALERRMAVASRTQQTHATEHEIGGGDSIDFPENPTDGNAPSASPAPTLTPGFRTMLVSFPTVNNADPTQYEVWWHTETFTPPGAGTLHGEVFAGINTGSEQLAALITDLEPSTEYFVRIIAKDADGSAAPGTEASATTTDAPTFLNVDTLATLTAITGKLYAPNTTGWRTELGDESFPIRYWDGTNAKFYTDNDGNIYLKGRVDFGTASRLTADDLIDLVEQPTTVQTPAFVQKNVAASTTPASSGAVTWPAPTQDGDLLLAYVITNSTRTHTTPSGWTLVRSQVQGVLRISLYKIVGAASRSGSQSFTFSGAASFVVGVTEWQGVALEDVQAGSNSASATEASTGTTGTTTQAEELLYGIVANLGLSFAAKFLAKWGSAGSGNGQFTSPFDVATDSAGNVYVTDGGNNRVQKFDSAGTYVAQWGTTGSGDGQFDSPVGIAVDGSDNVYVTDGSNHRVQKFSSAGTFITKWGTNGTGDGQFSGPRGIAVGPSGDVYVVDQGNDRVQRFTSTGTFVAKWGTTGTGDGQFHTPYGVDVDSQENVYVVDSPTDRVQKFSSTGTFILKWGAAGTGDGQLGFAYEVSVDRSTDEVYVSDYENGRVQRFTSGGAFISRWGTTGSGDGQFNAVGLHFHSASAIYVVDFTGAQIQKFALASPSSAFSVAQDAQATASGVPSLTARTGTKVVTATGTAGFTNGYAGTGLYAGLIATFKAKAGGTIETPPANTVRLGAKDKSGVSTLYYKKDDGTEVEVGAQGYELLGRTTLTVAGDTITVSSLPVRKFLKVLAFASDTGGTIGITLRLNNDAGNNYARRASTNGGAESTAASTDALIVSGAAAQPFLFEGTISNNLAGVEKLCIGHDIFEGGAGAAAIPSRREYVAKWANTADQVTRVDLINTGTGDFDVGSEVVVLGHD